MNKLKGADFENRVQKILDYYAVNGWMKAEKVDPPTAFTKRGILYKKSPFLDFVGSWKEKGGKSIMFEAKRTLKRRLAIGGAGITESQLDAIHEWSGAGAFTFVLWECPTDEKYELNPYIHFPVVCIPGENILKLIANEGINSLKPSDGVAVPSYKDGVMAFEYPDFRKVLNDWFQ